MKKIAIDMNPVIHGSRAVKRCTACIVSELIQNTELNIDLFYFDYRKQKKKFLKLLNNHVRESVICFPQRLLLPLWRRFDWPNLEILLSENDILYTNEFYFPPTKKTLVLATIHGLSYKIIPEKLPLQTVKSCNDGLSYILSHADYLIAVSETSKRELVNHVGIDQERIYVITHGVDGQFRQLKNRQFLFKRLKDAFNLKTPFILFVGAIGIHKNVMGLLKAYKLVSDKIPHHMVMAGPPDSAWDQAHQFVAENRLFTRVHFPGTVDQSGDNLLDLYNAADLFVFPSFYEGWTSPPLEAMACGTPVIASNCSSLSETLGNAAVQIDPNNHEGLAVEIERVLSDKALQLDLVKRGFEHVAKHTWENAAAKLIDVFNDAMARGPWKKKR